MMHMPITLLRTNREKVIFLLAKDCLKEFKVECDLRILSPRTTKSYCNSTALFLNYLDKHLQIGGLKFIRPPHIKKYIQYLLEKKLSPSYINGILKYLRAFYKHAHNEGYLIVYPAIKINWHREGKPGKYTSCQLHHAIDNWKAAKPAARSKL